MFFIFGWGRTTIKQLGKVLPVKCTNCNNVQYWNLVRKRTWFTLFFIPVIPYSNQTYLICPICSSGITLNNLMAKEAENLVAVTDRYMSNPPTITEEEYIESINKVSLF